MVSKSGNEKWGDGGGGGLKAPRSMGVVAVVTGMVRGAACQDQDGAGRGAGAWRIL